MGAVFSLACWQKTLYAAAYDNKTASYRAKAPPTLRPWPSPPLLVWDLVHFLSRCPCAAAFSSVQSRLSQNR
jgi:hypothetical protein